jgi:hypothetical protein
MIPPVTVVVDGRTIAASQQAMLAGGIVVAPAQPFLRDIAPTIVADRARGTLTLSRNGDTVTVTVGSRLARVGGAGVLLPIAPYLRDGVVVIPLAAVARALGSSAAFEGASKTLRIALPPTAPLGTPSPYAPIPGGPSPLPVRVDPTPAPRATTPGSPVPRRTPIEADPSLPAGHP